LKGSYGWRSASPNLPEALSQLRNFPRREQKIVKASRRRATLFSSRDCGKPDRHLALIAAVYGKMPEGRCREISEATSDRVETVR